MSDLHRDRMNNRLNRVDAARSLYDRMKEIDAPAFDQRKVSSPLQKASKSVDDDSFEMYITEALGSIAAQARSAGYDDLADDARDALNEVES